MFYFSLTNMVFLGRKQAAGADIIAAHASETATAGSAAGAQCAGFFTNWFEGSQRKDPHLQFSGRFRP